MRPYELMARNRAVPFVPYRIRFDFGRTIDVCYPEMVKVGRQTLTFYTFLSGQTEVYDGAEMFGLDLIERIEPIPIPSVA